MSGYNARSSDTVQVACSCQHRNPGCVRCRGVGSVSKRACKRCHGTGRTGDVCLDCRGDGWRELDQPSIA